MGWNDIPHNHSVFTVLVELPGHSLKEIGVGESLHMEDKFHEVYVVTRLEDFKEAFNG